MAFIRKLLNITCS